MTKKINHHTARENIIQKNRYQNQMANAHCQRSPGTEEIDTMVKAVEGLKTDPIRHQTDIDHPESQSKVVAIKGEKEATVKKENLEEIVKENTIGRERRRGILVVQIPHKEVARKVELND